MSLPGILYILCLLFQARHQLLICHMGCIQYNIIIPYCFCLYCQECLVLHSLLTGPSISFSCYGDCFHICPVSCGYSSLLCHPYLIGPVKMTGTAFINYSSVGLKSTIFSLNYLCKTYRKYMRFFESIDVHNSFILSSF